MRQDASIDKRARAVRRSLGIAILFVPFLCSGQSYTISTVAGSGPGVDSGDGGPATQAYLCGPAAVTMDSSGNLYLAEPCGNNVRKISPSGIITTIAGPSQGGTSGYSGDGGPATSALLDDPEGIAVDSAGNVYIAEDGNAVIRKVSPNGTISTVAGNGQQPIHPIDGVAATSNGLAGAHGVAVDSAGNIYIAEEGFARVRKVTPDGIISTFAGGGAPYTFSAGPLGDGGPATQATFASPMALTFDSAGNLYIADSTAEKVRKVAPNGIISTVAGNAPQPGFSGDGGPATSASFYTPRGIAVDAAGNLFIADTINNRVRMVSANGTITTVAGNGNDAYSGEGAATTAGLANPNGLWASGNKVYVATVDDGRIRLLTPGTTGGGSLPPVISEVDNAFSNLANSPIESGSWVVIKGNNLSSTSPGRGWNANESFPTSMDGTTVTINGKPAFLYYISPSQLNVQAPADSAMGPVNVVVTNNGMNSTPVTAQYQSDAPALLQWGGGQYAYALITRGGDYIGNPVLIQNTVSAHAGDTLTLWATGLGPTSPAIPAGQQPATFPSVTPMPTVTVGGANVTVLAAVLRYAGLYQLNIQLPASVPTGDQPIQIVEGSYQSSFGVLINIQ